MEKLIIGVHPNEGTTRQPNADVPFLPEEIAAVIADCVDSGAAVSHFHARTPDGGMDQTVETYRQCFARIRERTPVLLAPSLANVPGWSVAQRTANVAVDAALRPEFMVIEMGCAVMDLWDPTSRSFQTDDRMFLNNTVVQDELLTAAGELGMLPWFVSFNNSWSRAIQCQLDTGKVTTPFVVQFVLGGPEFPAAHSVDAAGLEAHMLAMPTGHRYHWFVSAYRGNLLEVAAGVITRGGHLSIGVGDYHYQEVGLPGNAELVARIAELARSMGREVATPEEARQILGVSAR